MRLASLSQSKNGRVPSRTQLPYRLHVKQLESRGVLPRQLAVMGDSLSASYFGQPYGVAGDQSWVEQLQALRSRQVVIHDLAFSGATSDSLVDSGPSHLIP